MATLNLHQKRKKKLKSRANKLAKLDTLDRKESKTAPSDNSRLGRGLRNYWIRKWFHINDTTLGKLSD